MCGICGVFNFPVESADINSMIGGLLHRGPDDKGIYIDDSRSLGLGHTRLSIIEVSQKGHQPMISGIGRSVIVFNGEIYNFLELKEKLIKIGKIFKTDSDTEVLQNAYECWGVDCLNYLKGMFAFAIFDYSNETLFIARDRLGEKPLYYSRLGSDGILFSSECRSLLKSGLVKSKINRRALSNFLAHQTVHFPETLIKDIYSLEPGHYIIVRRGEFSKHRYWAPKIDTVGDKEAVTVTIRDLFIKSVERQLISDVPLGAFLSGGIDSTVIVGVASALSKKKFNTYTVAFDDQYFLDGHYSRIAAKKFNTQHHEIKLDMNEVLNLVPKALNSSDHPSADGINSYIVSNAVRGTGVKVALSGLGGDEIFGGYSSFKLLKSLERLQYLFRLIPIEIRRKAGNILLSDSTTIHDHKKIAYFQSSLDIFSSYDLSRRFLFNHQLVKLGVPLFQFSKDIESVVDETNVYSMVSSLEIRHYMHDVLLRDTDQYSMANSLEVRAPFLDHDLIDYVLSLPDSFKTNGGFNKSLLVKSLSEFVPLEIVTRPKQGFSMPFDRWMRNELNSFCIDHIDYLKKLNLFNPNYIDFLWNQFRAKPQSVNWSRIWLLVSLTNWIRVNNIDTGD